MSELDRSGVLLFAALGDLAIAFVLAVVASLLLRRFMVRLVERHPKVARDLIEPVEGRSHRLYSFLKERRSRELQDPRAHALAISAYVCAWIVLLLIVLSALSVVASLFV